MLRRRALQQWPSDACPCEHPLSLAPHYVAVVHTGFFDDSDTTSLEGYYRSLGQQVIPTVADGDCGIDAMLKIIGEQSTPLARKQLREELADFIVARIQQQWFQELMAACQEVTLEEVKQFRFLEQCVSQGELVAPSVVAPAVAEAAEDVRALAPQAGCEELLKAVAWHTGLKDERAVGGRGGARACGTRGFFASIQEPRYT